jgi:hypothetical protein
MEGQMTIPDAVTYLETANPPVTSQAAEAIDRLYLEMGAEGWKAGARSEEVEVTDRLMIEGGRYDGGMTWRAKRCNRCNGRLSYHPFTRGREYRPFTICLRCGRTREF